MLARALIVLLLVLNIGVAAWWALRPPHAQSAPPPAPGPGLQLLSEADARAPAEVPPTDSAASPDAAGDPGTPASAPVRLQCFSLGPYDEATAAVARERLGPAAARIALRRVPSSAPTAWRVLLPPQGSAEAAKAMAARIAAAGFKDYLVLHEGEDANGVALGLYHGQEAARARARALADKGFEARVAPVGGDGEEVWLDVAAAATQPAASLQSRAGAAHRVPLDCARLP